MIRGPNRHLSSFYISCITFFSGYLFNKKVLKKNAIFSNVAQLNELKQSIRVALEELVVKSTTRVPTDVFQKLEEIKDKEKKSLVVSPQIDLMVENIEYGCKNEIPICQDTGLQNFFLQIGENFPMLTGFKSIIREVLKKLTMASKIRPNTVDPITQQNKGFNSGKGMPPIYTEIVESSNELIITLLNKGGGSENISKLFMLSAANGFEQFVGKIVETIKDAGGKPCPPVILGVGLGGDAVKSMYLAKKALLRPLGSRNPRRDIAKLEEEILTKVNNEEIGVMGLGGKSNCLDVRMEWAMRHPASYPVGLVVQCYSHRTLSVKISRDGTKDFGKLNANYAFTSEKNIFSLRKEGSKK